MIMRKLLLTALAVLGICMSWTPIKANACAIPVFRYALERWPPYPYQIIVFHDKALDKKEEDAIEAIEESYSNLSGWHVDLNDKLPEELSLIWEEEKKKADLPWLVVRYPEQFWGVVDSKTFWSGPFDLQKLSEVTSSPARTELVQNMLRGISSVWVYVEGGDKENDDAKVKILKDRLAMIKKEAILPPEAFEEVGQGEMADTVPLKIDFEIIRLARDDPKEQVFLNMLLKTERELGKHKNEPMFFPVFGQGRALWALIGKGINDEMIDRICEFMLGDCSCEIKDLNPGVDLLITADWFGGISNILSVSDIPPTLVGINPTTPEAQVKETDQKELSKETVEDDPNGLSLYKAIGAAFLAIIIIVGFVSVIIARQRKE